MFQSCSNEVIMKKLVDSVSFKCSDGLCSCVLSKFISTKPAQPQERPMLSIALTSNSKLEYNQKVSQFIVHLTMYFQSSLFTWFEYTKRNKFGSIKKPSLLICASLFE